MDFQDIILRLQGYWAGRGCVLQQPCDIEVGAGTFNPATFLRVLGPEPWRVAYVEPSRRPTDGRYGDNPWRTGYFYQYQVILKPSPPDIQHIYLKSLEHLEIDLKQHDLRFVEDDWESPTLGASGLGWEVWLDGSEITQYTYFQQMGSIDLDPISVEITYGLERIALDSQNVDSFFDIEWAAGVTYGDVHHQSEVEFSKYYLNEADTAMLFRLFDIYEKEAVACLNKGLILPAADHVLKCSHTFNVLDARKSISVTERVSYIARVRNLARRCAQGYCKQREDMGYPLLDAEAQKAGKQDNLKTRQPDNRTTGQLASRPSGFLDFLLEIGTEEIPSSYIQPALDQMEEQISGLLKESRIDFKSVRTLGTPRRLVLSVTGLSTRQPDRNVDIVGPSGLVSFDEEGNWTKAAEGFARKLEVTVDDLKVKEIKGREYIYLPRLEEGKPTIELLSEELPKLIASLRSPKSMHFSSSEDGNLQFARPIRWIVALLGEDVINFNVGRVRSDRFTFGHRLLSTGAIVLEDASPDGFRENLRKAGVIVDHEERRLLIRKQVTHALESEGCPVHIDEELLDTVTFLVEMPRAVVGTFSETYLSLPVEVLETAMKKHQRYFSFRRSLPAVEDTESQKAREPDNRKSGFPALRLSGSPASLLPKFITITNGVGDEGVIRHGNERVLRSRLADAEFFYREDQKSRLADKTGKLNHVVFQEELGSLYDKTQRLKELAFFICENLGIAEENICDNAVCAAELCKVDLVTQMVIEFPSLQGIMGGYYAANSGETDEVAEAIRCHYYPTSPDGTLPSSITGSIVSIADKLDTIVGYFGIGNIPSGSQDPYSLRRQATGIVRILAEYELHLALDQAVEKALSLYNQFDPRVRGDSYVSPAGVLSGVDEQSLRDSILQFLRGRISALLSERGFTYDIINSILADSVAQAACLWDVPNIIKRADALSRFRNRPDFDRIYPAFNRVIRILPKEGPDSDDVDKQLFQDQAERNLYGSMVQIEEDVKQAAAYGEYDKVLDQLAGLRTVIDTFFDEVLVMTERDDLRSNRLTLLQRLVNMFSLVADFSMLVE